MFKERQQSTTTYPMPISLFSGTNAVAGLGTNVTVTLSKNGGAFAAAAGAVSELSNGVYLLAGNATDRGTVGPLVLRAAGGTADVFLDYYGIVAYDPFGVFDSNSRVTLSSGTGAGQLDFTAGVVKSNFVQLNGGTISATTFPSNFASLAIDASGRVDVGAVRGILVSALETAGVVNDVAPSASTFATTIANGTTADQYKYGVMVFTSGALSGLPGRAITAWGTNTKPTFNAAWPTAPANGDTFLILGCAK